MYLKKILVKHFTELKTPLSYRHGRCFISESPIATLPQFKRRRSSEKQIRYFGIWPTDAQLTEKNMPLLKAPR